MATVLNRPEPKSDRWVKSVCKMCLHTCGILVHVEDGVVTSYQTSR